VTEAGTFSGPAVDDRQMRRLDNPDTGDRKAFPEPVRTTAEAPRQVLKSTGESRVAVRPAKDREFASIFDCTRSEIGKA
jgi:hypothetical protein